MNRNIPTAPTAEPMFADERTLASYVRGLTFHPDDVPVFGIPEARSFMAEILADDFGWQRLDHATLAWGDSGTAVRFQVWIGGQHTIEVTEFEGSSSIPERTVRFEGELRTMFPRALDYLAALQGR